LTGVDVIIEILVEVNVGWGMKKPTVGDTKGISADGRGNAVFTGLGTGNGPSGRKPEKKIPVITMAAMPIPISNPALRYFISGCILMSIG